MTSNFLVHATQSLYKLTPRPDWVTFSSHDVSYSTAEFTFVLVLLNTDFCRTTRGCAPMAPPHVSHWGRESTWQTMITRMGQLALLHRSWTGLIWSSSAVRFLQSKHAKNGRSFLQCVLSLWGKEGAGHRAKQAAKLILASAPLHTQDTQIGLGALVWQPQLFGADVFCVTFDLFRFVLCLGIDTIC